ncbi:MAG TPA: D-amino acid aminotransferase [Longimicrobiales bacterium]|nr:D-amino acid aminotransferase [Longimicrobiales bacterium]
MSTVYLNGDYVPKAEARVSVDDRGFLLSDGVYEMVPYYEGVPFHLEAHLERLARSLKAVRIEYDVSSVGAVLRRLIADNGLEKATRARAYVQVTRGVAPRTHYFPKQAVEPTVYACVTEWSRPADDVWGRGFTAITVPDLRWARVDIKAISLLPNALAFQAALDAGVDDAILVRDGIAIEGAHQNFWGVFDGVAVTHPATNLILAGITRAVVLERARARGIPCEERPIPVEELSDAEELFFTGTTAEVRPCVQVDGRSVGDGRVGPVTKALSEAFLTAVEEVKEAASAVTR